MFVTILIGIMTAIAVPRIDFARFRTDSSAASLNSYVLLAQRLAVLRGHDVNVSFDETGQRLVIHQDRNNDGVTDTGEATQTEALHEGTQFGVVGAVLYGMGPDITFKAGALGDATLVFHRNGSASEEGAIHITSRPKGGAVYDRAVCITRATGLTKCFSRRSGSWQEGC